ncbi:hypothetical protein [Nostoc sp. 2RC]|uniref:hypothetical protein n=1 Tax=Nostoc sp. 2RC TaxID=2485484 RepID=UPI001626D2F3|nr:hypothetical protein [Nostoc sp. 2RC]MBC1241584.1 hypothetical protein [Nostoc sp. 2RC]
MRSPPHLPPVQNVQYRVNETQRLLGRAGGTYIVDVLADARTSRTAKKALLIVRPYLIPI